MKLYSKKIKKIINPLFTLLFCTTIFIACTNTSKESDSSDVSSSQEQAVEKSGQAFIKGDVAKPNILQIAIGSKDHSTLVKAVQATQLENALVNAGPLTVFAPTNEAFNALPEGTLEKLLKPESKNALANILKYHVTPGNYSKDFLKHFKKLGQANNQYVKVEVVDGEPVIGDAKIIASVPAGNGIVHVIDKVLLPPSK